jgi:hypothetical protein
MPDRPVLAFTLSPERTHHVFAPDDRDRLAACCTIPQLEPIRGEPLQHLIDPQLLEHMA